MADAGKDIGRRPSLNGRHPAHEVGAKPKQRKDHPFPSRAGADAPVDSPTVRAARAERGRGRGDAVGYRPVFPGELCAGGPVFRATGQNLDGEVGLQAGRFTDLDSPKRAPNRG